MSKNTSKIFKSIKEDKNLSNVPTEKRKEVAFKQAQQKILSQRTNDDIMFAVTTQQLALFSSEILKGTTFYKQALKNHLNSALNLIEYEILPQLYSIDEGYLKTMPKEERQKMQEELSDQFIDLVFTVQALTKAILLVKDEDKTRFDSELTALFEKYGVDIDKVTTV